MSVEEIEREVSAAYARLAASSALIRSRPAHYLGVLEREHESSVAELTRRHAALCAHAEAAHAAELAAAAIAHRRAKRELFTSAAALNTQDPWPLADFSAPAWADFRPGGEAPLPYALRIGRIDLSDGSQPGGADVPIPAMARFAGHGHLLISAERNQECALSLLQAATLRLAVATRPGSVRFALADPVGQGRHLSAFLRLPAAYRVGSRVAVSASDVEALLNTLTDHVVEITQDRLTNIFDSIEAYNATATGITTPYHVLVLTSFPAGFSDRAADLLTPLVRNGPRAGVYLLATTLLGERMPRSFTLAPLHDAATNLRVDVEGVVKWNDRDFSRWSIIPDLMPSAERVNRWLDAIGAAAIAVPQDLPFERIAISPAERWTGDSTDGLDVRIGIDSRGEPQFFSLGSPTVQHGLIGGDTRMGKTNLLHVLITQLALRYPPEEVEFYLLDFKEVEFDGYLTHQLPHARAIASRTDREFGLSMLRQFHQEIERRSRTFREAGVVTLREYRSETGLALARSLIVMDEFQVLFREDDLLSRQAGELLEDIARRGAAFGLHLLLATQSPGGSSHAIYLLRHTYEQMGLRIAFGCTLPSVSQAILGDGNEAATKLIRAGDAIYNDRRGEGANPVSRVANLPTTRNRREWIGVVKELGSGRIYPPPVSFEPDTPADFATHPACAAFVANARSRREPGPTLEAWLGEAIEIKPPTTATFERSIRSNLLVVGDQQYGHSMLLAAVLSAVVQCAPTDISFVVAEFAGATSQFQGFFTPLENLPHDVWVAGPRTANQALRVLTEELDRRLATTTASAPPGVLFLVAGLQRWSELLVDGDRSWEPNETAKALGRLIDEGPEVGVHVVAWADSYTSAERALRRQDISRFALRGAFRLTSPLESEALLGVPGATRLADDRAIFRDTEWPHERVEKFKPYSLASLQSFLLDAFDNPA